jgi:hypothetical protein
VRALENNPLFNAGRGSVLTEKETIEMEACIMDGKSKQCGAVSGVANVVNPISLARRIMEKTPHIYLGFEGAHEFARQQVLATLASPAHDPTSWNPNIAGIDISLQGVELAGPEYFRTETRLQQLRAKKAKQKVCCPRCSLERLARTIDCCRSSFFVRRWFTSICVKGRGRESTSQVGCGNCPEPRPGHLYSEPQVQNYVNRLQNLCRNIRNNYFI